MAHKKIFPRRCEVCGFYFGRLTDAEWSAKLPSHTTSLRHQEALNVTKAVQEFCDAEGLDRRVSKRFAHEVIRLLRESKTNQQKC